MRRTMLVSALVFVLLLISVSGPVTLNERAFDATNSGETPKTRGCAGTGSGHHASFPYPVCTYTEDEPVLVTSTGEEHYSFAVDPEHYGLFAVKAVTYPHTAHMDTLSFYDNPSYSGASIHEVRVTDTFGGGHRGLGFIVRNGHDMAENLSTYVKVQWNPGYQYRYEMEDGSSHGMRTMSIGEKTNGSMRAEEIVDCYQVRLDKGVNYNFTLEISEAADLDLFLLQGDLASSKNYFAYSWSASSGNTERIFHCTSEDAYYCLVVTNPIDTAGEYNVSVSVLQPDDSPISLHQKSKGFAGTGDFSIETQADSYSVFCMKYHDFPSRLLVYDNPGHLGGTVLDVACVSGDYIGSLLFFARLAGSESFKTYVKAGCKDETTAYQYEIEMENGQSTGMVHINTNSSIDGRTAVDELIDAYQVELTKGRDYVMTLMVPPEVDLDLCLLKGDRSHSGDYEKLMLTDLAGADEVIEFSPEESGKYLLLVLNREGYSSQYSLKVDEYGGSTTSTTTTSTTITTTGTTTTQQTSSTIQSSTTEHTSTPSFSEGIAVGGLIVCVTVAVLIVLVRRRT